MGRRGNMRALPGNAHWALRWVQSPPCEGCSWAMSRERMGRQRARRRWSRKSGCRSGKDSFGSGWQEGVCRRRRGQRAAGANLQRLIEALPPSLLLSCTGGKQEKGVKKAPGALTWIPELI